MDFRSTSFKGYNVLPRILRQLIAYFGVRTKTRDYLDQWFVIT